MSEVLLEEQTQGKTGLIKFDPSIAEVEELRKQYMGLTIYGVGDTEGLRKVHEARMVIKRKRIDAQKLEKAAKKQINELWSKVDQRAKEYYALLEPIENHLQKEEDRVEEEKRKIKEELQRKEQERISNRIDQLIKSGCTYDGTKYFIGEYTIDILQIKTYTEIQFGEFLAVVKREHERELRRKQEEEERLRKEREEFERRQREQEEEKRRLQQEMEELRRQKEELEKERERVRKQRLELRTKHLLSIGLCLSGNSSFYLGDKPFTSVGEISALDDSNWEDFLKDLVPQVEVQKAAMKAAEEKRAHEAEEERKRQEKLERERREALKPDKEKLMEFASKLSQFPLPTVSDPAANQIVVGTKTLIDKVVRYINDKTNELK